jgi:hypothetical protein
LEPRAGIAEKIEAYIGGMGSEHHRYRSWEHCYNHFHSATTEAIAEKRDLAALHLGFYLASWGMYRGSGFLLQHAYTVHRGVIESLSSSQFAPLWAEEFGVNGSNDARLVPTILEAIKSIRRAYAAFASEDQVSDTLVTKILLGTIGCTPACDRFFVAGFKHAGFQYSYVNKNFFGRVLRFSSDNLPILLEQQRNIERVSAVHYPVMKLVDMYFWEIGAELEGAESEEGQAATTGM